MRGPIRYYDTCEHIEMPLTFRLLNTPNAVGERYQHRLFCRLTLQMTLLLWSMPLKLSFTMVHTLKCLCL